MSNETSSEILSRMALDAAELIDVWESEGNRHLSEFENGNAIPMSIEEWAYALGALAQEVK